MKTLYDNECGGSDGKKFKISTTANGNVTIYAHNAVPPSQVSCAAPIIAYHNLKVSKNDPVYGSTSSTIYTVEPADAANYKY